jgi:hypothetical protein
MLLALIPRGESFVSDFDLQCIHIPVAIHGKFISLGGVPGQIAVGALNLFDFEALQRVEAPC